MQKRDTGKTKDQLWNPFSLPLGDNFREYIITSVLSLAKYGFIMVISGRGLVILCFCKPSKGNTRKYSSSRNAITNEGYQMLGTILRRAAFQPSSSETKATVRIQRGPQCKNRSQLSVLCSFLSVRNSTAFLFFLVKGAQKRRRKEFQRFVQFCRLREPAEVNKRISMGQKEHNNSVWIVNQISEIT